MLWRMRMLCCCVVALAIASTSVQPGPPAIIGRWDITIVRPDGGERSAWLEVRHSGIQTLVGQFVGTSGSARPISQVEFKDGEMRFAIPPQWERVDGNLVVAGKLEGDRLSGSMTLGGGTPVDGGSCPIAAPRRRAAVGGRGSVVQRARSVRLEGDWRRQRMGSGWRRAAQQERRRQPRDDRDLYRFQTAYRVPLSTRRQQRRVSAWTIRSADRRRPWR